jgi:hypothetical protein
MSAESLWGELPRRGDLRTPLTILREQAVLLGEATNNVLVGDVATSQRGPKFVSSLGIIAPALDNYRISILSITYDMTLYPLVISKELAGGSVPCKDEGSFKQALKDTLSSPRVHQVINSLLSQSEAA